MKCSMFLLIFWFVRFCFLFSIMNHTNEIFSTDQRGGTTNPFEILLRTMIIAVIVYVNAYDLQQHFWYQNSAQFRKTS